MATLPPTPTGLVTSWPPITVPIMTFTLPGWAPAPSPPRPERWTAAEPLFPGACPSTPAAAASASPGPGLPPGPAEALAAWKVRWSRTDLAAILNQLRHGLFDPLRWWRLGQQTYEDWCLPLPGEGNLLVTRFLSDRFRRAGVVLYPHQLATVRRVISDLGGRALLADEVGLGKTIEAALILKEYQLREGISRILILVPSSLVWQWYRELSDKFGLLPVLQRTAFDWQRPGVILASLDTAKRAEHRDILQSLEWDLVIVDEAHRLKNERTLNWQLVNRLRKRYLLLLTATPVQNDLKELFNLVHLLHPGSWGTWSSFRRRFLSADGRNPRDEQAAASLQRLLAETMIRHRHGPETVTLPPRHVHRIDVHLREDEWQLYDAVRGWVRRIYRERGYLDAHVFALLTLEREICSSPAAAALTLARITRTDPGDPQVFAALQVLLQQGFGSKLQTLVHLIRSLDRQLVVFTEYVASQAQILSILRQAGIVAFPFDGSMRPGRKEWIKRMFQQRGQVLVSTESGGEGINLQFCNTLVNYDLPWNPMRVEQRIGRLHRLGQTRPVEIYNLVTVGTVEEHIFYLLHEKIRLFENVVGELDGILSTRSGLEQFQRSLFTILVDWPGARQGRQALDALAQSLLAAARERRREPGGEFTPGPLGKKAIPP